MRPSELYPLPFPLLAARLAQEIEAGGPIYGLPRALVWAPDPARDLGTTHLGQRLGAPLGPAAGPHTQLAQNVVLAWLAGARFLELKTVQIRDDLEIPRPCIFVPHVGYNVEWSQELRIAESTTEYLQAWLLVHLAAERLGLPADALFDLSVGYDLAGIQSPPVHAFLQTLRQAGPALDALRAELPPALRPEAPACVSRSLTLSTFHGCPAGEIEAITTWLMRAHHLDVVVKLNPTLLGEPGVRAILHDRLGYTHIQLDPDAFTHDLQWDQLLDMLPRLRRVAADEGVGLGVKFSNTLVCHSAEAPFGAGPIYLSGPPLHPLAATLAARFLAATGGEVPVTFSAGVDAENFVSVLGAGIGPVTACTDLLKGKGYGRLCGYLRGLEAHMAGHGAATLAELPRQDPQAWAASTVADPRYAHARNRVAPRKIGSHLALLDCVTCDKCLPVCPNAAIETLTLPVGEHAAGRVRWSEGAWAVEAGDPLRVRRRHQIGILADLCNQCGQCDPVCPEDGGPFHEKPNRFLDPRAWAEHPERDGFLLEPGLLRWRRAGVEQRLRWEPATGRSDAPDVLWELPTGTLRLRLLPAAPPQVLAATGVGEADLADAVLLSLLRAALPEVDGWRASSGAGGLASPRAPTPDTRP